MARPIERPRTGRYLWIVPFLLVALYVAVRLSVTSLWVDTVTAQGDVRLPNTFATVDHPFHVARAAMLWRQLASGSLLRWVEQHQGGYPVEFYPLGEAWFEVAVRALSLGALPAEGAHTIAVGALLLLPGAVFAALAAEDRLPAVVALLALCLHLSLPGGWYHGGYTELVQWGLVTNVAGAVAAFAVLPALLRYLRGGAGWTGALAAGLAAMAVYSNPRSLLGVIALGCGVALSALLGGRVEVRVAGLRLLFVAVVVVLLAAPELGSLARFGDLYAFVRYSGYTRPADYLAATVDAVSLPVAALAAAGIALGLVRQRRPALTATAASLLLYVLGTFAVSFVPAIGGLAPQLEPTRLMPLQRLLTIYLAAVTIWLALRWLLSHLPMTARWSPGIAALAAVLILLVQTRPVAGPAPDPASPLIPPLSLYPVAMSAQPQQADLAAAVRAADETAAPGTALLVLGSALSWHQPLWAPLWTGRPLYYDNWLWFWHPHHVGTPGYRFEAGNHYPDPELTLRPEYLHQHGIGGVVVTGTARAAAARAAGLRRIRGGTYDAYVVTEPVTTVSSPAEPALSVAVGDGLVTAETETAADTFVARVNWFPRWSATIDGRPAAVERRADGYIDVRGEQPGHSLRLVYDTQPLDWVTRCLALAGLALALAAGRVARGTARAAAPAMLAADERGAPAAGRQGSDSSEVT